jgi:hypothetical protein
MGKIVILKEKAPATNRGFLYLYISSIAGGLELIGQADVVVW